MGTIRSGTWPRDVSSYTDPAIMKKSYSSQASFVTPIECAAEVLTRLEYCGIDGLILLAMECWGENQITLAKYLGLPAWVVLKKRKSAGCPKRENNEGICFANSGGIRINLKLKGAEPPAVWVQISAGPHSFLKK